MELVLLVCLATLACSNAFIFGKEKPGPVSGDVKMECVPPPAFNADREFGYDLTDYEASDYSKSKKSGEEEEAEKAMEKAIGSTGIEMLKAAGDCPTEQQGVSKRRPAYGKYWYHWRRNCEPCKTNAKYTYLWKFHNKRCFVIYPFWQRIRIVRCSYKECESPCACGNTKCLPTDWIRVWFFGWCRESYGAWKHGFNYNYLYLPQDCTCHEQVFNNLLWKGR